MNTLSAMADALKVTVRYLIYESDEEKIKEIIYNGE
jgi:hypothetical protein